MNCRGIRGRSKTKSVRFSSENPSASRIKPHQDYKDNHASSSNDQKSFGPDRRRSTENLRAIKCKFYKSVGDESSVERREFEIWNGPIHKLIGLSRPKFGHLCPINPDL